MLHRLAPLILATVSLPIAAAAQWSVVSPGVEYQEWTLASPRPLRVFAARMDRANIGVTMDALLDSAGLTSGTETVPAMATRAEDTITWWGQSWGLWRNDVVVAINGDLYTATVPTGGMLQSGWHAKRYPVCTGTSGPIWTVNRGMFIGGNVGFTSNRQRVVLPDATFEQINGINTTRSTNQIILYTPQHGTTTLTDNSGVEFVVGMTRPLVIVPQPTTANGTVRALRNNLGNARIQFDEVIISATGSKATTLLAKLSVGSTVGFSQEVNDYTRGQCVTSSGNDWTKAFCSVGDNFLFLDNGVVKDKVDLQTPQPRTAFAYNATHLFFMVADGRNPGISEGMTAVDMGNFCLGTLGATHGVNLDGGGSSTMWVDGLVRNTPSDGSPRSVANGLMFVRLVDNTTRSTAFTTGANVRTTASNPMRHGPGLNFTSFINYGANVPGVIAAHSLNGIVASGDAWWWVTVGATTGWMREDQLALVLPTDSMRVY